MKIKSALHRLLSLTLFFTIAITAPAFADDPPPHAPEGSLYAKAAVLMDGDSGRVLYEKQGYERLPMASTTKIMTCIIALEKGRPDDIVTASSYAASQPKVHLGVSSGDQFYLKDLLYSLMLESHNDTAVMIAEHIGGSVEGFAAMMNQKAKDLGANDTNFVTPNGLDAPGHETTAADLALIARYAIQNEKFNEITNTRNYTFTNVKGSRTCSVVNHDAFLEQMEGAMGVKTGFTNGAGYCFVGALKKDGKTLISVVLGCGWPPNKTWKWSDTRKLIRYGLDNYDYKQLFETGKEFLPIDVEDGQEPTVGLYLEDQELNLLVRGDEAVNVKYRVPKSLTAPVQKDTPVGQAEYYIGDQLYQSYPIYTADSVKKIDLRFCLQKIFDAWTFGSPLIPLLLGTK